MKLKTLPSMIAAAIGALSGAAMALPVSDFQLVAGDTAELYISGATAQEAGLRNTVSRMCTAGSLDIYQFGNQQAAFCTINKTVVTGAIPASVTKMVVYKSGVGGSGNGVGPVANGATGTPLAFLSMAALKANPALVIGPSTTVAAVAPTAPDTIGIPSFTRTTVDASATQNVITEAGFSDVEPKLLGATAAQIARLKVTAPNVLIFGVPVTTVARNALQAAQGLTVGSDAEADMPSLRKNLINSVYTGNITKWSQLGASIPASDTIYLATRVETSGTQKSFNVYVTGAACTAGLQAVLGNNSSAADCGSAAPVGNVFAGSSSNDVVACMNNHNQVGVARGAFGVLSMEFVPGATDGYRWIKIDGTSPTLTNVVNGNYNFWVEPTFQYRKSPGSPVLSGVKQIIADRINLQLGTEAVITTLNNAFVQPWGRSGLLAKPSGANVPNAIVPPTTDAAVAANPTNAFTRSPSGSPVNCQVPVLFN